MGVSKASASAVGKALDVMETIARADQPLRLTDLSNRLGLHRATVHRVIAELVERGWILRAGNHYLPGAAALQMSDATAHNSLVQISRPLLRELSQRTSMMVNLQVLEATGSRVLHVEYPSRLQMIAQLRGELLFVHRFAGPLAFVAMLEEDARPPYLAQARQAGYPMDGEEGLLAELRRTRERGYALERGRNEVGIASASVALTSTQGRPLCAVTIVGPDTEFGEENLETLLAELNATAAALQQRLRSPSSVGATVGEN